MARAMPNTLPASFNAKSYANKANAMVVKPVPTNAIIWAIKSCRKLLFLKGDKLFIYEIR